MSRVAFATFATFASTQACFCGGVPVPDPPPLRATPTGFFVGEAYVDDESVGGARVSVYGSAARATTSAGKQFVLQPIPVGEHTITLSSADGALERRFVQPLETGGQTVLLPPDATTLRAPAVVVGRVEVDGDPAPVGTIVYLVQGDGTQVANVGDDGTFTLGGLPVGPAALAASLAGYDVARVDVELVEGEQELDAPLDLAPVADEDLVLPLTGRVRIAGELVHAGTVVFLDDGEQIATTSGSGAYTFDVTPGRHALRAERPGYGTVELANVSVFEDGTVDEGLVDMFLAPATDAAAAPDGASLEVESPQAGSTVVVGVPLPFSADLVGVAADSPLAAQIEWRVRRLDDVGAPGALLGTGPLIAAVLPPDLADQLVVVEARVAGEELVDQVGVTAGPFVRAEADTDQDFAALVAAPVLVTADDGVLETRIDQGHPAFLRSLVEGAAVTWSEAGGSTYVDVVPLTTLPEGTYTFSARLVEEGGAQVDVLDVRVVVEPLEFAVSVVEPAEGTPYFTDAPLPLRLAITHGFQTGFPSTAVDWRSEDGLLVANGAVGATNGAPPGTQVLLIDVRDVVGNVRQAVAEYQLEAISFSASFNAPGDGTVVQLGEDVTFNVGFSHSRVPADDPSVYVTLTSDLQGRLSSGGVDEFAPNTDVVVDDLGPGFHEITARVFSGGRVASVRRTVEVQAPFVTASLVAPAVQNLLALDGQSMRFEVLVGSSPGEDPNVTWFIDGVEFDASWGGYGADPQADSRFVVDLGAYDDAVAPFDDAAWGDGTHTIQAWVRLDDAAAEAQGCANVGAISRCLTFTVRVFPTLTTKGAAGDVVLTSVSPTEVWSGGILLKARYILEGGTLVIQPGTFVVVDLEDRTTPGQVDSYSERNITFRDGTLQIGAPGTVPPVVFETRKQFPNNTEWQGIVNAFGAPDAVPRVVSLQNVVIRDASTGLDWNNGPIILPDGEMTIEDVTIEGGTHGMVVQCPASFARVRFADLSGTALHLDDDPLCPTSYAPLEGVEIAGADYGVYVPARATPTDVVLRDLVVSDVRVHGVDVQDRVRLLLEDGTFTRVGASYVGYAALHVNQTSPESSITVRGTTFDQGGTGILYRGGGNGDRFDVAGNLFSENARAVYYLSGIGAVGGVHLNRFVDNTQDFEIGGQNTPVLAAQGNFLGAFDDATTTGGALGSAATGTVVPLARVYDGFDTTGLSRVLLDNPLPDEALPHAFIQAPASGVLYSPQTCVPLVAGSPLAELDVATACTWTRFPVGGDPASGTALTAGSDDCAEQGIPDGEHGVALTCDDGVSTTVHTTRLLVDSTRLGSEVRPPGATITGDLLVDGDVYVHPGATLTLAPGARLRFASTDRARMSRPTISGAARLGSTAHAELVIAGELDVAGTEADPVILEPASTAAGASSWGGIVTELGGVVGVSFAQIRGPAIAFESHVSTTDPFTAPEVRASDVTLEAVGRVVTGTCPLQFTRVDVTGTEQNPVDCAAIQDFEVQGGSWTALSGSWFITVSAYQTPLSTPSVSIDGVTVIGSPSSSALALYLPYSDVSGVAIANSTFESFGTLVYGYSGTQAISVVDSTLRRWTNATQGVFEVGPEATIVIDHVLFEDGPRIVTDDFGSLTMRDSRVVDVTTAFATLNSNTVEVMTVSGNRFDGVGVVFDVEAFNGNAGAAAAWDLTGNDFLATSDQVLRVVGTSTALQTRFDLDGSHFGAGNDTNAEIEALLADPRTDANPSDTIEGNTDYTGFSATALALDVP